MVKRRRGHLHEKENEFPDSSPVENSTLENANLRTPSSQRTGEKPDRDITSIRHAPCEQLSESSIRETEVAVDGHLLSQRVLKSKFWNVFQQQRECETYNKDEVYKENEKQEETVNSRRLSSSIRRPPSARHSSRTGTEKRKNIHAVLAELKTRVRRTSKETNVESTLQQDVAQPISAELNQVQPASEIASDGMSSEKLFLSPQSSTGSVTAWLSRPKHQRSSLESITQNRRIPFRCDPSRGRSSGIFGSGAVNFPSSPNLGGDRLRQPSSFDTKLLQKGRAKNRRQPRRRNLPLRRTKSSNSLQVQRGSGFFWENPDVLFELSAESTLLDKIQELRTALERSEKALKDFVEESAKHRAETEEQVHRLKTLYSSLSQSQDMRYRSLLEVFHENHKLLGYVESNFDYVLSVVARGRRTNLQEYFFGLLQFVAHHAMVPILWVIRYGSRVYLRVFPRRAGPNG